MMKSIHHYNDFLIKFLPGGRPRPFFATGLPSSSNAGSALKKTKNKIEVSKWDKKNLALKIHNLMKNQDTPSSLRPSSRSPAWEVYPSLSWLASPLPLWPSLSGSENWRRWTYNRQNISALRVYGSNLPIKIAPCIIVKTIAWKNLRYQFLYYEMNECGTFFWATFNLAHFSLF